jgi:hypothetical protein
VNHNGTFYHLNPDLVFDVNQILLCRVCAENPMPKIKRVLQQATIMVDLAV